jgi:hypothetical protein
VQARLAGPALGVLEHQSFLLRRGVTLGDCQLGDCQLGGRQLGIVDAIVLASGLSGAGERVVAMPLLVVGVVCR